MSNGSDDYARFAMKLLDILVLLVDPGVQAKYAALKLKIQTMVNEGRDPTPEEWDALNAETTDLSDQLQEIAAAMAELETVPKEPPVPPATEEVKLGGSPSLTAKEVRRADRRLARDIRRFERGLRRGEGVVLRAAKRKRTRTT